jgi:predicted HTH domain antitoxin
MAMLLVPDDILREAGLNEREAIVELACRLFEAGRLTLWPAARLAGLDRVAMEEALAARCISIYCPTLDDLTQDMSTRSSECAPLESCDPP